MEKLKALHNELMDLFKYYAELEGALSFWHEHLKNTVRDVAGPGASYLVSQHDPTEAGATYLYKKTFGDGIRDSAKDGRHAMMHARAVITLAYALWEDKFREQIAVECGFKSRDDIKSGVFGDLNKYRQAILHVGSCLDREPEVAKFFKEGDKVDFTEDQMTELFSVMIEELNRIGKEYYKSDPGFSLEQALAKLGRPNFL